MSRRIPAVLTEYNSKLKYSFVFQREEGEVFSLLNFATAFKEQWERETSMSSSGLNKFLYVPHVYHLLLGCASLKL